MSTWHPRGTPTWPDWKTAQAGQRVEHVRSGVTGTFVKARFAPKGQSAGGSFAVIDWDARPPFNRVHRGRVVAPAFDLRPI